jgi:hypothetical protein
MKIWALLFIVLLANSCEQNKAESNSFYYWKTTYNPTKFENDYVEKHNVKNIYIRCFDVMYETENSYKPSNVVLWNQKPNPKINYIPVVFIDKKIFEQIDSVQNKELSKNIMKLCKQIFDSQHLPISEIQIDCDWAGLSKENYFYFLKEIKKDVKIVSATLRLHQYKYQTQSGIPPVDYCSLMCYNIGDVKSNNNSNSILNKIDFDSYTKGDYYPKPINIALPIYTWSLLFRNNQFAGILPQIPILDTGNWRKINGLQYECKNSFLDTISSRYFYSQDVIKVENCSKEEWNTITTYIKNKIKNPKHEIIYFDMDSASIQNYLLR